MPGGVSRKFGNVSFRFVLDVPTFLTGPRLFFGAFQPSRHGVFTALRTVVFHDICIPLADEVLARIAETLKRNELINLLISHSLL